MILLGSILHFTEDEKDKALISEGPGTFDRVYGAVAAPLPRSKLDADKIEGDSIFIHGDNLREKWVNFLLAETGEEEEGGTGWCLNVNILSQKSLQLCGHLQD